MLVVMLAVCGAAVGSFIGLVTVRLPIAANILVGRSRCGGCQRALAPWDLVPVISYASTLGQCRTCRARIPWRYPVLEGACCAIGVGGGLLADGNVPTGIFSAILGWQLLLIAWIDAEHFWLPDTLTVPLAVSGVLASLAIDGMSAAQSVVGLIGGYLGLELVRRLYKQLRRREGMGGGDPIFFGALGAWVGIGGLPIVLLLACLFGIGWALAERFVRRCNVEDRLPFGLHLSVAVAFIWTVGHMTGSFAPGALSG